MKNTKDIMEYWPFDYEPRQSQTKALTWLAKQESKYLILEAPVGCHLAGTKILKADGTTIPVEDIRVDDMLMGPDSIPRQVLDLHNGKEMMYTITPTKGDLFVVNENHILSLKLTSTKQQTYTQDVVNISVKEYLLKSKNFKNLYKLYRTDAIAFHTQEKISMNPYILGLYLGDGYSGNGRFEIASADIEVVDSIMTEASNMEMTVRVDNANAICSSYCFTSGNVGGTHTKNKMMDQLRNLDLYDKRGKNKFIPFEYKTSSKHNRLQLLAGLLDSDGTLQDYTFTITLNSEQLIDDICFISRSLGFSSSKTSFVDKSGLTYHRAIIGGDVHVIPTKIKRKQAPNVVRRKRSTIVGFEVSVYGSDQYYGFEVNCDHLYVMGDFTVAHNSGKSNIGVTLTSYLQGQSFILTPQRILQQQYEQSFKDNDDLNVSVLYGKSNYTCSDKNSTCDIGNIIKPRCGDCPHTEAKKVAKLSKNAVLNYKLALTSFAFTETFEKRKLMILDECHTLEEQLVNFDSLQVLDWRCKKYNLPFKILPDLASTLNWMKDIYMPNLTDKLDDLQSDSDILFDKPGDELTRADIKLMRELDAFADHVDEVQEMTLRTNEYVNDNFVLVWDKVHFELKRLTGEYSFRRIVFPKADKFLFMSSTILDKDGFCQDLGIDPKDAAFLSLDSDFPVENRPVVYMPQMKMNFKWKHDENKHTRNNMLQSIKQLLDIHKGQSGIIHTGNFAVAQWLVEELGNIDQDIYHHNPDSGDDRNAIIHAFISAPKPGVLISPSSTEGLDLKDDLGRFAIFAKIGFPYLGDQWIKRRMEMSTAWYQRRTLIDVIQGAGRIVRSETDEGSVYILDSSFGYLKSKTNHMIPEWWEKAYNVI